MPFTGQLRVSKTTAPQMSVAVYDACGNAALECKLMSGNTPGDHFTRTLTAR